MQLLHLHPSALILPYQLLVHLHSSASPGACCVRSIPLVHLRPSASPGACCVSWFSFGPFASNYVTKRLVRPIGPFDPHNPASPGVPCVSRVLFVIFMSISIVFLFASFCVNFRLLCLFQSLCVSLYLLASSCILILENSGVSSCLPVRLSRRHASKTH